MSDDIQYRPSSGAYAEARDQQRSFWLNGQVDAGSQSQTTRLDSSKKIFQQGLIIIDHSNQTAKNVSTNSLVGDKPRTRGRMQYMSAIGANGIIVLIGGNQKVVTDTTDRSLGDLVSEQRRDCCSQELIDFADANGSSPCFRCFFDLRRSGRYFMVRAAGDWRHTRKASGLLYNESQCYRQFKQQHVSLPEKTVKESSADRKSYMYGGRGANDVVFDDIHILSIPSFSKLSSHDG
ncbi:MAG: hypothetical protein Q9186_002938 [Xanthomendoza sp. 1 TL-2023]